LDGHIFNDSEMALFIECMLKCAPILIDNADIVREAILQQLAQPQPNVCQLMARQI
jgi:hypothetical protein